MMLGLVGKSRLIVQRFGVEKEYSILGEGCLQDKRIKILFIRENGIMKGHEDRTHSIIRTPYPHNRSKGKAVMKHAPRRLNILYHEAPPYNARGIPNKNLHTDQARKIWRWKRREDCQKKRKKKNWELELMLKQVALRTLGE
jgi:hypothetical protein